MIEFIEWISIFVVAGLAAPFFGPFVVNQLVPFSISEVLSLATDFLSLWQPYAYNKPRVVVPWKRVPNSIATWLIVFLVAGLLLGSPLNTPARVSSGNVQDVRGVSGPETADLDTGATALLSQVHTITLDPGRTDRPLTVRYTWSPPGIAVELPEQAAAFMTGAGPKDMKINAALPCPSQ